MNVGVTGATGFVGTHVVQLLRDHGHVVTTLGRQASATVRHLDLAKRPLSPGTFEGLDAVVHAAAYLPASYADPSEAQRCMDINALGTLALLQACAQAGVRHVVHLSTNLYRLAAAPVTEHAAFEPSTQASYYLVSKAAADFFAAHSRSALGVSILRLGSVYGPGLARGVIATFTSQLLAGTPIAVDDGNYQADFVHVADVAAAIAAAVEQAPGTFNIGSGVATRPLEIARLVAEATGSAPELIRTKPAADRELRGFSALDVSHARATLGFAPRALDSGLADYVRWRRAQP